MIGERFIGHAAPDAPLTFALPHGSRLIGLRVDAACKVSLQLDGREAARATVSAAADDGDMPGSGYSLMLELDGQAEAAVFVSAPAGVWGMTE